MIIIQTEKNDRSTNDVIDWLKYYKNTKINLLHNQYRINSLRIELNNSFTRIEINKVNISEQFKYWYRRGYFSFVESSEVRNYYDEVLYKYIMLESDTIKEYLSYCFYDIGLGINNQEENRASKIKNLHFARKAKLNIPHTQITSSIESLINFSKLFDKIIFKPIMVPVINFSDANKSYTFGFMPKVIDHNSILSFIGTKKIHSIAPSFMQQYIEKKYELRIFYLNETIMPMCIMSQSNIMTQYDFRNYDYSRPNRIVPYNLPTGIVKKIQKFAQFSGIKCGSIDMIVTPNDEYYFLEVNSVGQFQWLSKGCNYFIERHIAQYYGQI
jgi:hypothetical protein